MNKLIQEKGVTLIALVITIIVLLILAGVSIVALTGQEGILTKAKQAAQNTADAEADENVKLGEYENYLNKYTGGSSGGSGGGSEVTPGTPVTADTTYTDSDNKEAVIPQGFRVSEEADEQKINTGLVVIGPDDSEFVWVPVDKTTLCADGTTDKEIAELTSGTDANGRLNYQGKLYDFLGTGSEITSSEMTSYGQATTSFREPAYLINTFCADGSSYNTIGITSDSLQEEYNSIIESIKNNGGFYVGRYEASIRGETIKTVKADVYPMTAATNNQMWYGMYQKEQEYASKLKNSHTEINSNLKSAMITGSCYDAMLNWALNGSDKSKVTEYTNGNHSGSVAEVGSYSNDKINNIFDLEGNVSEWTSEACDKIYRGYGRRQLRLFLFSERS